MELKDILLLGDPRLYKVSEEVNRDEVPSLMPVVLEMAELVLKYREKYGAGRAIAAPQVGVFKRLVVMNIDRPVAIFNPCFENLSDEMISLWDDCMSFPNLLVKVKRHKQCTLIYRDETWKENNWLLKDDMAELLQHEVDHLDGILATQRAVDNQSFKLVINDQ